MRTTHNTPELRVTCDCAGCLVELCPDGSVPPTPPGRCCPSGLLCPRDCQGVTCNIYHCRDGSVAPVSPGLCCPDPLLCLDSLSCAEWECPPAFCPNGDLAPHPPGNCQLWAEMILTALTCRPVLPRPQPLLHGRL